MKYKIERIDRPISLGEGPHWDADKQKLYYVDLWTSCICCYDNETKRVSKTLICDGEKNVTLIVPIENETDKYLITFGADVATIKWDGVNEATDFEIVACTPNPNGELRFNDGKCSPGGILLAGTTEVNYSRDENAPGKGAFYALKDGELVELLDDMRLPNGLAWSLDGNKLYFIDSLRYQVFSADYDAENIKLSNRKVLFDFKANHIPGFPDGMTIDRKGNLWVAAYEGSRVLYIDPTDGKLLDTIKMPTTHITSVAFGGPDLNELYVTSCAEDIAKEKDENDQDAGCLFKVTGLPAGGFPGVPAKM